MRRARGSKGTFTHEIETEEGDAIQLTVSYTISAYNPGSMYKRNGDPGDPPEGGEIEDLEVKDGAGVDWDTKLTPVQRSDIETACFERAEDQAEADEEDWADARAEALAERDYERYYP